MSGQRERQPSTQPEGRGSIGDYRSAEGRGPIKGRGPVSGPGPTGRRGPMRNYGPMGIGRTVRKAKDFKGTLKRLLKYLKPHRARLAVVLIFAAASTVFSIAAPKIMSRAMNSLQESYMADTMLKELAKAQRAAVDAVNRHLAAGASGQDGLEGWMPGPSAGDMENIREPDMGLIREFLELPMLDTITDADMKADVCMRLIALGGRLQEMMPASPENAGNVGDAVKYTDEQVENVINAIRRTNGEYDFKYIGGIILVLIGLYLLSALFNLTMGLVMSGVAQNTVRDLRREVDRKLPGCRSGITT